MTAERTGLIACAVGDDVAGPRVYPEPDDPLRKPLVRDRHRIIESTAFRRLEHKTQVFHAGQHDHFRTRLTHTLEVSQVARCLAAELRVNESLAEAITLAHDLGHPPFGHAGETELSELMTEHGGFNHNLHSLRVVDYLEHPFPAFRGLNLTAEVRSGLASHATAYDEPTDADDGASEFGPLLDARPTVESQVASIADRLAYAGHDLEDAIGAGLVTADELMSVAIWSESFPKVPDGGTDPLIHRFRRVVIERMLDEAIADCLNTSRPRIEPFQSVGEARTARVQLVSLSSAMEKRWRELERFLFERVYRHAEVSATDRAGRAAVRDVFSAYVADPRLMPERFVARIEELGVHRVVCDYVAGMTDRFCLRERARLCGE